MKNDKNLRAKRKRRIRARLSGTADRPRLAVYRSNKTLSVQVIDDAAGVTLFSAQSDGKNVNKAKELGQKVAQMAKEKGVSKVVFDRGGFQYHGSIKELAESARAGGLQF